MVFAVDFDGTLCENNYPLIGEPKLNIINKCKELQSKGHKLILWTCREGRLLNEAIMWCHRNYGLIFDSVNNNLSERLDLFEIDSRKVGADFYIDDRNMSLNDFNNLMLED